MHIKRNQEQKNPKVISTMVFHQQLLKINEYGGPDVKEYQPTFDIRQRSTRKLDFTNSQYIQTQWKETSVV